MECSPGVNHRHFAVAMAPIDQCAGHKVERGNLRPHDLLRLRCGDVIAAENSAPAWVQSALSEAPYVVVRRCPAPLRMVAVGVRGSSRRERFGTFAPRCEIAELITPEFLARAEIRQTQSRRALIPALRALDGVAPVLARGGFAWGPVGSVGFELATGRATARPSSDLDIVIYCPERLRRKTAGELAASLVAADCRIDTILETPAGGVSLVDLADACDAVLARTGHGSILTKDPWADSRQEAECS